MERYAELKKQGCNIQRLDTAASGMSAEAGEFMEIVKKLKFQGKDFNAANKEHLTKELGDIMWYVAQACLALGVRFDEVIYINTLKLAARYPGGMFETNYSENRAPGDI
jgi:NTP pyrophosphatase (non-canonical NTP hydrolase)